MAAAQNSVDWAARLAEKAFDWAVAKGPSIIAALVILFIAWIVAGWLRRLIISATSRAHVDATLGKFLGNLAKWAVLGFSVTICLNVVGVPATTFAAVIAAIGLAVGLALQGNLGNLASGVLLLIFRPFKVGDSVIVAGQAGVVESIDLFTTNLDTGDNRRVIVPNGAICGGVIENQSHHERRCLTMTVQASPFGLDYKKEGMLIAMIVHPPAFGLKLKSFDGAAAKTMPGIKDVFKINVYNEGETQWCDTISFNELFVVVGNTTWEVMNAKKAITCEWEQIKSKEIEVPFFGRTKKISTPSGLENTDDHLAKMIAASKSAATVVRKDGDPEAAFKKATTILERSYTAPFLAHSPLEPMNFFAHVTADKAELVGPIQTPEFMEKSASVRLGLPIEKIDIQMTRMGGGFGRRLYGHFLIEVAVITQKMNAPVKLIYTREDDMTTGIYRPAYHATYRAALDENKNLIAFHVKTGGVPESSLSANRFPAGAVDNYLAEEWTIVSNVSLDAFRAPGSNFIAGAEQSFLDELAETMGKDPIDLRLELLEKAKTNPVGKDNDYEAERYAGVLQLIKEKSGWGKDTPGLHRGIAAYFCHNTYVAQIVDIEMKDNHPTIQKVTAAVDCGLVINPVAATNLAEGGIIDGIGHGSYSAITLKDGVPQQNNFTTYRLIRHREVPKAIEVHFVDNKKDPTGLGEPLNPPVIGALANALYKATGKRYYDQPFLVDPKLMG